MRPSRSSPRLPDTGASQTQLANGLDLMVEEIATESVGVLNQVKLRDPFLPAAPPAASAEAPAPTRRRLRRTTRWSTSSPG